MDAFQAGDLSLGTFVGRGSAAHFGRAAEAGPQNMTSPQNNPAIARRLGLAMELARQLAAPKAPPPSILPPSSPPSPRAAYKKHTSAVAATSTLRR
jgi:hypothetical protein